MINNVFIGVWRSWLARRVWDAEAAGSSPATPTKKSTAFRRSFSWFELLDENLTFA